MSKQSHALPWLGFLCASTAAALAPRTVHAEALDQGNVSFGAGVFVGYKFLGKQSVEWGVEAFMTKRLHGFEQCSSDERMGIGPLVQFALLGVSNPRITVAAQGGGELTRGAVALSGELGVSYRFGERPGFGVHIGIVPEVFFWNVAFRYQALRNEAWLGGGMRFFPTYGEPGMCAIGRPLRTSHGACDFVPLAVPPMAASAREQAAHGFARDAQLEAASVTAFVQLALELRAHGAPSALLQAAYAAAHDEVSHAQLCARLAERHLTQRVPYTYPDVTVRDPALATLSTLAIESWQDGCLAEASAALHAARAAERASDLTTAQVLRRIAHDEARHGELAWHVLEFCLQRGGVEVQRALRDHIAGGDREPARMNVPDSLERFGRLSARELHALSLAQRARSLDRLRARWGV